MITMKMQKIPQFAWIRSLRNSRALGNVSTTGDGHRMVHLFRRGSTLDQALDVRNVEVLVEYCFWYSLGQVKG